MYRSNNTNLSIYSYQNIYCRHSNHLLGLRELTTAHKYVRQESTPVKIRILTTFGQNKKTQHIEIRQEA